MKILFASTASSRLSLSILAALTFACWHSQFQYCAAVTLTMDEIPRQPVNGLSYQGVTFGFQIDGVDSLDASYNETGPGEQMFVQDPTIEGNANGVLTIDFAVTTPELEFGVALSTEEPLSPGFTVELFDSELMSLGVTPVDTSIQTIEFEFTEGQFVFAGELVSRATVGFEPSAGRFALDNLTFVPEPSAFGLFIMAMIAGIRPRLQRQRSNPDLRRKD